MNHYTSGMLLLILWLFCITYTNAQPKVEKNKVITKSLEGLIEEALANNQQLKIRSMEQQLAEKDLQKAQGIYLPQVKTSITGTYTNLPLNAFGTRLNQGIITQADFNPADLNDPDGIDNLQTILEVRQPIYNPHLIPLRKAAAANVQAQKFRTARIKSYIKYELTKAYLQLQYFYALKAVLEEAKNLGEANEELANNNFSEGLIQEVDVVDVKVRIKEVENQIFQVEYHIQDASDYLHFLKNTTADGVIAPADTLAYTDQAGLINEQLEGRSDFQALKFGIEGRQHQLESTKKAMLPTANAFGSYALNNPLSFDEVTGGYLLGVQLSWDVFKGNQRKRNQEKATIEVQKVQAEYQQLVNQNKLELQKAKRMMEQAQSQIDLSGQLIKQAEERLRITIDRFEEGLEKTTDLLNAEVNLSQKRLNRLQAILDYKLAAASIEFLIEK
jgi:outer membrane protein TolC